MQNVYNVWYNLPAGTSHFLLTYYKSFTFKMQKDSKDIFSSIIILTHVFGLKPKNPEILIAEV